MSDKTKKSPGELGGNQGGKTERAGDAQLTKHLQDTTGDAEMQELLIALSVYRARHHLKRAADHRAKAAESYTTLRHILENKQ